MSAQRVDVLAVMALAPEHIRVLKAFAQDTGGFRANSKQAADLAAACAAALNMAEALARVQGGEA